MSRVDEGFKDISSGDAPGFVDVEVTDIPDYLIRELLNEDPEDSDGRSQAVAIRFPNGDLVVGFYPQGDAYEELTQHYGV